MERAKRTWVVAAVSLLFVPAGCTSHYERIQMNAREKVAILDVGVINMAQLQYYNFAGKYATSLSELCGSRNGSPAPTISGKVCTGEEHEYVFTVASTAPEKSYTIDARPKTPGSSGRRFFYSDQTLIIHQSENKPATANSPQVK